MELCILIDRDRAADFDQLLTEMPDVKMLFYSNSPKRKFFVVQANDQDSNFLKLKYGDSVWTRSAL